VAGADRGSDASPAGRPFPVPTPRPRATRRRRSVAPFLLASVVPVGGTVWWFTRAPEDRERFLASIPKGAGTRAVTAAIAMGALIVLARVVLPGARGASEALRRARAWIRGRGRGARVALAPVALLVEVLWLLTQVVFAVDAIAIVACGLAFLVYVARIVRPDLLPSLPG